MENYIEKINVYLNNTFSAFPQTEQSVKLKNDMLGSMTDKFNELMSEGLGEDAAFGRVIGEFGSVEEIKEILGAEGTPVNNESQPSLGMTMYPVTEERRQAYEKSKWNGTIMIIVGVVLCGFAVFSWDFYDTFLINEVCELIFGSLIAAGVFLFVKAGCISGRFFEVKAPVYYAALPTEERFAEYTRFLDKRSWRIPTAVAMFVVSPFLCDAVGVFLRTVPFGLGETIADLVFWGVVTGGIIILVLTGAEHNRYDDVRLVEKKKKVKNRCMWVIR